MLLCGEENLREMVASTCRRSDAPCAWQLAYNYARRFHPCPLGAACRREVKAAFAAATSAAALPGDAWLDTEQRKNCGRVALRRRQQRQQRDASFRRDADAEFSAGRFDEMCHRVGQPRQIRT